VAFSMAILRRLRMFAQVEHKQFVSMGLMVEFERH